MSASVSNKEMNAIRVRNSHSCLCFLLRLLTLLGMAQCSHLLLLRIPQEAYSMDPARREIDAGGRGGNGILVSRDGHLTRATACSPRGRNRRDSWSRLRCRAAQLRCRYGRGHATASWAGLVLALEELTNSSTAIVVVLLRWWSGRRLLLRATAVVRPFSTGNQTVRPDAARVN